MGTHRPERVAHLVQVELAGLLSREARDQRLSGVTVTGVRVSADLRHARVFFRTLEEAARPAAERALDRANAFLRRELGRRLGLRVTPELRFEWDSAIDVARRLEGALRRNGVPADDEGDT